MTWINLPLAVTTLTVTLGLETAIVPNLPIRYDRSTITETSPRAWTVSQTYMPPNRQAPRTTVGGATRGGCLENSGLLRSLMPANNLGLTIAEYPTLYWDIPSSKAERLEFELRDAKENRLVKKTLTIPSIPGVIGLTLPKSELPPLAVGKMYHWYLTMVCPSEDSGDKSGNVIVDGWIERTQPSPTLVKELEKAAPGDRWAIYAAAGIWYDSLTTLAELRRANPDDSTLADRWEKLLKSVDLDPIAEKPLVDCCTPTPPLSTQH